MCHSIHVEVKPSEVGSLLPCFSPFHVSGCQALTFIFFSYYILYIPWQLLIRYASDVLKQKKDCVYAASHLVIPALRRRRQKTHKPEASLDCQSFPGQTRLKLRLSTTNQSQQQPTCHRTEFLLWWHSVLAGQRLLEEKEVMEPPIRHQKEE